MIWKFRCNLCKKELRASGLCKTGTTQEEHLLEYHTTEYQQLMTLHKLVMKAKKKLSDFDVKLFTDID